MAKEKNISYEQMCKGSKVFEDSEVPYWDVPLVNNFESKIPLSNGKDQSGFEPGVSNKKGA